ncbi:MAG: hypothetical protein ABSG88_15255 [Bradyrhizobium sp.]
MQNSQSAKLAGLHEPGVADDIGRKHRSMSPFDAHRKAPTP